MTFASMESRGPLPAWTGCRPEAAPCRAGQLVARFLGVHEALSCAAAAELAGVRPETIRKWRRRLPRWLKASTARRLGACLSGAPAAAPEDGLQRAFRLRLRSIPTDT